MVISSPFSNTPKPSSSSFSITIISTPKPLLSCLNYSHPKTPKIPKTQKLAINGPSELSGHVSISGSKNESLPILAATLCCWGTSKLTNVPNLSDTKTMVSVLRPVDLYVRGFRALGALVHIRDGKFHANAANGKGLVGGRFHLDYPSVGATETLLMAACLADGVTVLSNAAKEPEVVALARFLSNAGACIEGAGTNKIVIKGKSCLHGSEYKISPDRIETGSFMLAAAITRSRISISPVIPSDLSCLIEKLRGAGCTIRQLSHDSLEVSALSTDGTNLKGFDIKTGPFPAFPTDLQPQTMALLTTCDGFSLVEECVFENRMSHANELVKLGARIQVCGSTALVSGKDKRFLSGTSLVGTDLRGGVSLVLAGLAATGTTEIAGVEHIDRGYENLVLKLQKLGADVKRLIPLSCQS
uniref:UDP-N-acetylglucosamine 1-carboxyvinyltransferase n=1 Tax=Cannabis sativa TaxID=3483 RepID=A0A803QH78_CANSA